MGLLADMTASTKRQESNPKYGPLLVPSGREFETVIYDGRVHVIALLPIVAARGFLAGLDTCVLRDQDRT